MSAARLLSILVLLVLLPFAAHADEAFMPRPKLLHSLAAPAPSAVVAAAQIEAGDEPLVAYAPAQPGLRVGDLRIVAGYGRGDETAEVIDDGVLLDASFDGPYACATFNF